MNLGVAIIGIASTAACAMPFVLSSANRKREEKLMRDKAKVPAVGPPMINTMARPQTVPVGMSRRSKSRSEALRQTVYNHFEL